MVADTPRTNCEDGSSDPNCGTTPVIDKKRPASAAPPQSPKPPTPPRHEQGGPAPAPPHSPAASHSPSPSPSPGAELAESGSDHSQALLYGGLAVSLCGLGALALAAVRSRRR
ncbi:hypothetical protein OKJ48_01970 [Streptomyces kunmingensis]|uniref:Gram-positive cocci surface proteins LPxTG domain-containing protein n=1 Tax=Streptomyces kunmingensis TaxID=68225 RepID=A0ABU6C5E4_9ACTN|nr:hypothetical protein [Streptomyces kunmingensis]MEB3959030.1 hypothetical protein [Streptomyces kunmingensis]